MPNPYPDLLEHRREAPSMFDNDGGDQELTVTRVMRPGSVNSVEFVPNWSQAGANTNSRTYTLFNRKTGSGTTTIAQMLLTSGTSVSRGVAMSFSITSGNAAIAVGDILQWESLHVGAGMQDPGGLIVVQQSLNP